MFKLLVSSLAKKLSVMQLYWEVIINQIFRGCFYSVRGFATEFLCKNDVELLTINQCHPFCSHALNNRERKKGSEKKKERKGKISLSPPRKFLLCSVIRSGLP